MKAKRNTGNQNKSRKSDLLRLLLRARNSLHFGMTSNARRLLRTFWLQHALAPASTRRRWRCGR